MFEFVIRDDDPNYFTDPDELQSAYAALPEHIPVSFAVVPFHGGTKSRAIPEDRWEDERRYPIGDNPELVNYLKGGLDEGSLSIMLHSYDHVKRDGVPEFVAASDPQRRIRDGKRYLESLFDTAIDVFVPPNNSFSREGLDAVKEVGLGTFYYPTPVSRPKSLAVASVFTRDMMFKYRHTEGGAVSFVKRADRFWRKNDRDIFMPIRPFSYSLRGVPEVTAMSMTSSDAVDQVKRQLRLADRYDGIFSLAVHYHSFREDRFSDAFYDVVHYARRNLDPEFVTAREAFERIS